MSCDQRKESTRPTRYGAAPGTAVPRSIHETGFKPAADPVLTSPVSPGLFSFGWELQRLSQTPGGSSRGNQGRQAHLRGLPTTPSSLAVWRRGMGACEGRLGAFVARGFNRRVLHAARSFETASSAVGAGRSAAV